jgi:hypothetical protein
LGTVVGAKISYKISAKIANIRFANPRQNLKLGHEYEHSQE